MNLGDFIATRQRHSSPLSLLEDLQANFLCIPWRLDNLWNLVLRGGGSDFLLKARRPVYSLELEVLWFGESLALKTPG